MKEQGVQEFNVISWGESKSRRLEKIKTQSLSRWAEASGKLVTGIELDRKDDEISPLRQAIATQKAVALATVITEVYDEDPSLIFAFEKGVKREWTFRTRNMNFTSQRELSGHRQHLSSFDQSNDPVSENS